MPTENAPEEETSEEGESETASMIEEEVLSESEEEISQDTPPEENSTEVIKEEEEAPIFRTNDDGAHVRLELSYLDSFEYLRQIAKIVRDESAKIGIEIILSPETPDSFREKIRSKHTSCSCFLNTWDTIWMRIHIFISPRREKMVLITPTGKLRSEYSSGRNSYNTRCRETP